MQTESSIGATGAPSDAGVTSTVGAPESSRPSTQDTSLAPQGTASTPTAENVQGAEGTTESDPFELTGLPTDQELESTETVSKKAFLQIKGAFEPLKSTYKELQAKFSPFEPFADRFSSSEELQSAIELNDKLFGFERDDKGQLIPATQTFAQDLAKRDPAIADYLAADLLDMETTDPETGRSLPRIDLALEAMRDDPARRANALRILGGVEPSAIAPTWLPSAEELAAIPKDPDRVTPEEKALQDVYGKLPYDERESLKLNDPDFIRNYLKKEQFQQNLIEQNRIGQERETRQQQQREQYIRQQASEAGNKYVEQGFRQGMSEFTKSVVERSKFISPIDPSSEAARQMEPTQLAETNQRIEKINNGVGMMVATVTAALSHPDTAWAMQDFLKGIGVDEKVIQGFDSSRLEYARNARDYGELNFSAQGQNGNGNGQPQNGLGALQSNANRAMKSMKGYGNAIAQPLLSLLSDFFEMKAGSYNATLNGASAVRPPVSGTAYDPTKAPPAQQSTRFMTRQEIERTYGG